MQHFRSDGWRRVTEPITPKTLIRNVRPWGREASDVVVDHPATPAAAIAEISPHDPRRLAEDDGANVVEGRGRLLFPAFSDVHVHLDSTRIGLPFRPHTGAPGVWAMMLNDRENWRSAEAPIGERAATTLERMIARGTTRVRSYAQVDVDCRLERFDAVFAAKERYAHAADVQIIAFPQAGILREDGTEKLLESAMQAGADVVGGLDPSALDRDPARHLDIVFGLAEKYLAPIDIHLHESGTLGAFTTELILERTRALGMQGKVTISHAFQLSSIDEASLSALIDEMAELDVSVATVAPPPPRHVPLVRLAQAGVRVGLGEDGQRDYWSPYGNADMLDRTWQLAFTQGFRRDELIEHCLAVATVGGASVLDPTARRVRGLGDQPGIDLGAPADFVIVDGETPAAAVMDRGSDRTVLHRGLVVADGLSVLGA
ncbi:MAG: amidohydrolase family protein [Sinomonas sp.]|nr:amidohydrolase family protein [Sinomonas sp.]